MIMNQVEDNLILQRHENKNDVICLNVSILRRTELYYACLILIFKFFYELSLHALIRPVSVYSFLGYAS